MSEPIPLSASALLVIDAQETFRQGASWPERGNPDFEPNLTRLVDAYREAGLPVYFILHFDQDPGWERTNPNHRVMDFLEPRADEPILHKSSHNAFTTTDLQRLLTLQGVRRLAITGIRTEQCCETTARVASDLGYQVDFILDATLTFPIRHLENGRVVDELSVAEIERRTAFALRNRFARIVRTEDLLSELACA